MSFRRMMLATLGAYVQGLIDAFKARVLAFPGIFEAEACLKTQLDAVNNINLLQDATIVITPNGYNEDILHTVKGNTITAPPYNLSEYTEAFINIQSTGLNNAISTTDINPFGVAKSLRMVSNATNSAHRVNKNTFIIQKTSTYTYSIYLKKGSGATAPDVMQLIAQRAGAIDVSANFNLITGVTTNPINCTSSINNTGLTAGWWRCSITFSANVANSLSIGVAFCNNNPLAGTAPTYVDAITSDALIFGFQIEDNILATTYQPILFTQILERGYAQHTRSTTGYKVDSDGLVREVPQENLIGASENMLLSTVTKSLLTVVANTEPSPIANSIPMLLNDGTGAGRRRVANTTPQLISIGEEFMLSVYAKKAQHDWIQVSPVNTNYNLDDWANFNLATGTIGNKGATGTAYIESIGNGWYRCSVLCRAVNNVTQQIDVCQSIGNVNGGRYPNLSGTNQNVFYICGNTFTRGNTVKPYYPTLLRTNTPRIDYTDGSCPTLLLEAAVSNQLIRSEEFDNASWIKSNLTATQNTEVAPNGLLTADTLLATSNNGYITQNGPTSLGNIPCIFSVYLKRKTGVGNVVLEIGRTISTVVINSSTWTRCFVLDTALSSTYTIVSGAHTITTSVPHNMVTGDRVRFHLLTIATGSGAVSTNPTITVTGPTTFTFTVGTSTATGTSNIFANYGRIKLAVSGDEVYAWGAQLETIPTTLQNGYYEPTSYIPTTTATVTRTTEALNLYKIRDNNLLNNTFSVFWEVRKIGGGGTNSHLLISDTNGVSSTNSIQINGLPLALRKTDNSVNTSLTTPYLPLSTNYYKGLITCNNGVVEIWIDGSKMVTTPFTNYTRLTNLVLGSQDNGISRFKQVLGWNKVLNRAEIDLLFAYPYFNAGYTPVNNELQQIINRANAEGFTIPSTTILGYCDTLITEMKNDGVWNVSDVYFNFAYNDVTLSDWARINWMNPYGGLGIATTSGTVSYQTNGFQGNGTNGQLFTNVNLNRVSLNYTLNNAGRLAVVSVAATSAVKVIDSSGGFNANALYNESTNAHAINGTNVGFVNLSGIGLKSIMRDSSTSVRLQSLGVVSTIANNSTTIDVSNTQLFKNNSGYSNVCVSNYWIGASINNVQINNFRTYYNTYLTNIGLTAFA